MRRKLAALLALIGIGITAAGCNTIQGAGKDIKAAGGAIEKTAEESKPY